MHNIIPILISTVAIATALNVFLKRFGMPTVIGYILTGAIIGSMFGIHIHGNDQLEHVAEFGVVFLMFTIGLEFSFSHLKSMKKEVFLYGVLQVLLSGAVLAIVARLALGIGYKSAIIVGAGMALSSTAIVLKLLNESGKIETEFGKNSLGILIFQDMAVIPILLLITIFTSHDKSISELMTDTVINAVLALGILILIGKLALKHVFKAVSNTNSKEIYMGSILLIVVGASYIAHHFGFSYSLGGFIAGMMIADTIYKYQIEADLIPFRDLLLGVFFVSVGLQIDPMIVVKNIGWVLLLGIIVMVLKTLILFIVLSIAGDKKVALRTAFTLAEIGEFSLVVFSLILASNMLDPVMVQIFMVTIIMSMVATPFIINNIDKIVDLFIKGDITDTPIAKSGATGGRVILCGYGSFGEAVSVKLYDAGIDHIIITNNTDAFVRGKEAGKNVVFGDASDRMLLENLHIRDAMNTIIAIDDFEKVKLVRTAITLIDPELKVIARVATEEDKRELTEFNHELLIDGNSHSASLLVDQISRSKLLAQETSSLKYLCDYSVGNPNVAMNLVTLEQTRLLDIISRSFDGLREEKDIMYIKALHDSFDVLREIIGNAISDIMKNASLSSVQYNRISTLLDNQQQLVLMNDVLVDLAKDLKILEKEKDTKKFSHAAVEALDAVLMSLKDIANDYNEMELEILRTLTGEEDGGISIIRDTYLGDEKHLDQKTKAKLLSSTGNMTRLKQLFRTVGVNYQKLAQVA